MVQFEQAIVSSSHGDIETFHWEIANGFNGPVFACTRTAVVHGNLEIVVGSKSSSCQRMKRIRIEANPLFKEGKDLHLLYKTTIVLRLRKNQYRDSVHWV